MEEMGEVEMKDVNAMERKKGGKVRKSGETANEDESMELDVVE